ncbi:hypothetical protein BD626DRAFT_633443 [Schizophyllum amplum]|uniref:Protein kinase domain-containing protein n=1 Tax=Schizophyllum amplum TaxID=97359 RepID=A0A550C2U8_9AGAR|nr:hypothetical protein BD626DRAFT_633443 [Auriculariopsis ampla]
MPQSKRSRRRATAAQGHHRRRAPTALSTSSSTREELQRASLGYSYTPSPSPAAFSLPNHLVLAQDYVADIEKTSLTVCMIADTLFADEKFTPLPGQILRALDKTLYNVKTRKWLCYPELSLSSDDLQREHAMAAFLNEFTRHCWLLQKQTGKNQRLPAHALRWTVTNSVRTLLNGETVEAPGIALVDTRVTDMQWSDVLCDVQLVSRDDLMPQALQLLTTGAANVFSTQEDRMYHVGIAFAGDTFQIAIFDRAGRIVTGAFDVHSHCLLLARTLMGLTMLDSSYCGKDASVMMRDGRRFVIVGGLEYEILQTLSTSSSIRGRGTVCWRCRRRDSDMDYVIKNVWADTRQQPSEGDFLRKASNIDGVANLIDEEVIPWPDGEYRTTLWLRDLVRGPNRYTDVSHIPHLELRRLVLEPYGRPLKEFSSKDELLFALRDAIHAHECLYENEDVLHCDISDNNILLHEPAGASRRRGILIDLDCAAAVELQEGFKVGPLGRSAGTLPFMACDILRFRAAHAPWHDLESFLYVLIFICASYAGPSNTPRKDFDLRASALGPWLTGDGLTKFVIMCSYNDQEFRKFQDEVFHPYFDDLKDFVGELRTLIMRTWDEYPTHRAVLDVFDRHLRARQSAAEDVTATHPRTDGSASPVDHTPREGAKRKRSDENDNVVADFPHGRRDSHTVHGRTRADASSDSHTSDDSDGTLVEKLYSTQAARDDIDVECKRRKVVYFD